MKPGDKVEFSPLGRKTFSSTRLKTGIITRMHRLNLNYIWVRRGNQKQAEVWHRDFWMPADPQEGRAG